MSECRRPLEDWERPYLERLGEKVRNLRDALRFSRAALGNAVSLSDTQIKRIEYGTSRTRSSTLTRIVEVFADEYGWDDPIALAVLEDLIATAGPALAPESEHADRVERRRTRREARKRKDFHRALELAGPMARELAREHIDEWRSFYGRPIPRRER